MACASVGNQKLWVVYYSHVNCTLVIDSWSWWSWSDSLIKLFMNVSDLGLVAFSLKTVFEQGENMTRLGGLNRDHEKTNTINYWLNYLVCRGMNKVTPHSICLAGKKDSEGKRVWRRPTKRAPTSATITNSPWVSDAKVYLICNKCANVSSYLFCIYLYVGQSLEIPFKLFNLQMTFLKQGRLKLNKMKTLICGLIVIRIYQI